MKRVISEHCEARHSDTAGDLEPGCLIITAEASVQGVHSLEESTLKVAATSI